MDLRNKRPLLQTWPHNPVRNFEIGGGGRTCPTCSNNGDGRFFRRQRNSLHHPSQSCPAFVVEALCSDVRLMTITTKPMSSSSASPLPALHFTTGTAISLITAIVPAMGHPVSSPSCVRQACGRPVRVLTSTPQACGRPVCEFTSARWACGHPVCEFTSARLVPG